MCTDEIEKSQSVADDENEGPNEERKEVNIHPWIPNFAGVVSGEKNKIVQLSQFFLKYPIIERPTTHQDAIKIIYKYNAKRRGQEDIHSFDIIFYHLFSRLLHARNMQHALNI